MTTPHRNMLMSKLLMAGQYDRDTPSPVDLSRYGTPLVQRGAIAPFGTYTNGQTGLAWPGILAEAPQSFNNLWKYGYNGGAGDTQGVEDAFNVAGALGLGGIAAPRPRNSLGAFSSRIQEQIHEAQRAANPGVDPNKLAQVTSRQNGHVKIVSPVGQMHADLNGGRLQIESSRLDDGIPTGKGYGAPLYDEAARFAAANGVPLTSDGMVSSLAQRMYQRASRNYPVETNPSAWRGSFGTMYMPGGEPVYTVRVPPSGARPPPLPSWLDHVRPGDI